MAAVTDDQLAELAPYIAGARPDNRGEIEIYCPLHSDNRRSASINVNKGVWCCHAGCGGGSLRQLVMASDGWVAAGERAFDVRKPAAPPVEENVTMREVKHWHNRLRREVGLVRWAKQNRGIDYDTLRRANIGWDGKVYKIPVYGPGRCLWNVRNYDPNPAPGRSKIWNTRGMGGPRLYPYNTLRKAAFNDPILFCEGEWDTLLAIQHGVIAVTTTQGAGKPWQDEWTEEFVGHKVYLCHDADDAGEVSDAIVCEALSEVAEVYQCALPFRPVRTGGSDLTDYIMMFRPRARNEMMTDLVESATRKV